MFGSSDKKKNKEFVGKAQAARQQRAEEKEREKAAIRIQVNLNLIQELFQTRLIIIDNELNNTL